MRFSSNTKSCLKAVTLTMLISLLPSVPVMSQNFNDEPDMPQTDVFGEELSAPDHRSDNAFLRRYSSGKDELSHLSLTVNSRIRRKLVFNMSFTGNAGSGDYAPFWFTSNRQGLSTTEPSGLMMRLGLNGSMHLPNQFHFSYGMDVAVAAGYQSDYYLHQIYVDAGYKWFDLSVGAKERWGELVNPSLSSGGLTWSGNSRPIPQIRLEVPEFTRLGILGGLVSLKGHIAYGWYKDNDWREDQAIKYSNPPEYTDHILHHSKSMFIRIGDTERFPLEFIAGLEMYAQFGGTRHNIRLNPDEPLTESVDLPHDAQSYWKILLPVNKEGEQSKENGNTLGSWHLALGLTLDKWQYRLYYEHFYEDHSSMLGIENKPDLGGHRNLISFGMKRNWLDGLFGLEINAPEGLPFSNIVFEVLNTRGQCGPILIDGNTIIKNGDPIIKEVVDGKDDMYSHAIYSSYTNFGYANGNPALISPAYNKDGDLYFRSNRVLMYHLGIDGHITERLDYRLLTTHATHWGTYNRPFHDKESITSVLMECFYHQKESYSWRFGVSIGADFSSSKLLGDNKGIMFTISKLWRML